MTIQKGKVTVPQTINITVWPRLRKQKLVLQQQHSRWQARRPQQARLSYGVSEANPASVKAKDLENHLVVVEDPVALRVEDPQVGVFQEEEPQEEFQELQEEEETQNLGEIHPQNLTETVLRQAPS